jgi:hypothetical protein
MITAPCAAARLLLTSTYCVCVGRQIREAMRADPNI